ncbi:MAG: LURP-one-related family protein [Chloroflexaceae bacterium]|nr:LURP-one-related family protein [Chloroflexaceae bacterium]
MRGRQQAREQRQQERETFGRRGTAVHYKVRQRMVAIGDDFWIEDSDGRRAYKVDGKVLRVRSTLIIEDAQGQVQCRVQERMLRVRDTMEIEGPNGERMATVRKALITPLRDRWTVKIGDGPDLEVQGNILHHEYTIGEGNRKIAEVSKKWFRIRDQYGVQIEPGQNEALILAVTIVIDMMAHGGR